MSIAARLRINLIQNVFQTFQGYGFPLIAPRVFIVPKLTITLSRTPFTFPIPCLELRKVGMILQRGQNPRKHCSSHNPVRHRVVGAPSLNLASMPLVVHCTKFQSSVHQIENRYQQSETAQVRSTLNVVRRLVTADCVRLFGIMHQKRQVQRPTPHACPSAAAISSKSRALGAQ